MILSWQPKLTALVVSSRYLNSNIFFYYGGPGKDVNPPGNPEQLFLSKTALTVCHSEKMISPRFGVLTKPDSLKK